MNSNNKLKRKKKTHGPGNPSKRHRDRLNAELDNLARLLPFPEETVTKLDKISILRLTVSYLRAKSFFQVNGKNGQEETCEDLVREFEGNGLFSQLSLEALDGFIVVITQEGQLFYVSENVRDFLGYSQAAVIHQSMFKFLHIDDQDMVKLKLAWPNNISKDTKIDKEIPRRRDSTSGKPTENGKSDLSELEKLNRSFTCRMKCTLNHGGGFYKLFRLSGRLRAIQTRKRDNDVVEYGLFAICSPAYDSNNGSSGSSVKKEVALAAHKRLERTNSDPLGNRRSVYPSHSMMRTAHVGPFLYPNSRPPLSPLASPTASSDSGHPPVSNNIKPTLSDQEMQSDISDLSNSSKSSFETESRVQDRVYGAANQNRMHNMIRNEQKTKPSQIDTDESPMRKRSRSLADASEIHPSEYEAFRKNHPFGFGNANHLPSIAEVKNEGKTETANENVKANSEDQNTKEDGLLRRPLGNFDSRLDAARGLMNLGGMHLPLPSMYPFPEFMYPDVMFPRFDGLSNPLDVSPIRNPFDVHNPCCLPREQYSQLAMRRWLSASEMLRTAMNPLLAAQTAMMSPVERMRLFQMQFPFGFPFPGHAPFEFPGGLNERHLAEQRQTPNRADGESSSLPHTNPFKEIPVGGSKQEDEKRPSPKGSPTSGNTSDQELNVVKVEKEENEEKTFCGKENSDEPQGPVRSDTKTTSKSHCPVDQNNEMNDSNSQFRVNFKGIQAEFSNRLESLDRSFTESLGGFGPKDK
ncbi:uncharacterized protein LOC116290748 isoform X2 [Actinia tenebrosa]|uniref:Uncharacterized protein LOC116290748 isoform X2 n=1 Tax=Actinia tenebrosa TaxID=6105 RepID=A0A6P8HDF5_ACTTE|nr:uncharacterized protein LOC116290748 isoform X2 [Actinia tenebrosa]